MTLCAEDCVPNFFTPLVFNETDVIVSIYGYFITASAQATAAPGIGNIMCLLYNVIDRDFCLQGMDY